MAVLSSLTPWLLAGEKWLYAEGRHVWAWRGVKRTRASGASKRPQCQPLLLLLMGELWAWWGTGAGTVH